MWLQVRLNSFSLAQSSHDNSNSRSSYFVVVVVVVWGGGCILNEVVGIVFVVNCFLSLLSGVAFIAFVVKAVAVVVYCFCCCWYCLSSCCFYWWKKCLMDVKKWMKDFLRETKKVWNIFLLCLKQKPDITMRFFYSATPIYKLQDLEILENTMFTLKMFVQAWVKIFNTLLHKADADLSM